MLELPHLIMHFHSHTLLCFYLFLKVPHSETYGWCCWSPCSWTWNARSLLYFIVHFCGLPCDVVGPIFFAVFPQDLILFRRISKAVQHALFGRNWLVYRTVCMFYLALFIAPRIGVWWQLGSSSLVCPAIAITVSICPVLVVFRRFPPFVDLFRGFHMLEHLVGIPVSPGFEIPPL